MDEVLAKFLSNHYKKYLEEPLKVGFTEGFPEDKTKVEDRFVYEFTHNQRTPKLEVRLTKLTFGKQNQFDVLGIVTDIYRVERYCAFGGHEYADEAKIMQTAALIFAEKHGLMICLNVCSWPFVKLVVQKPTEAHLRCFKKENPELF